MSDEKRETVSDIVAQMRGCGEDGRMDMSLWRDYVDRIEAAWKRERAKVEADALEVGAIVEAARERTAEKLSAVGNAAAMREALEAMNRIDTRGLKRLLCELVEADIFDGGQINKTISAVEKARRALSAPARNCDLYDNKTDAETRFVEETGENDMAHHYWQMFANWLFYNNERKGEGDGR